VNLYFDTSIYNQILDDPNKDIIINKINQRKMTAIPSIVNLCEILLTSDKKRKKKLLALYDEIRNNFFPLKAPPDLLRDAISALNRNKKEIQVNYPIKVDKETEDICKKLKNTVGLELDKYIKGARIFVEKNSDKIKRDNPKSFFDSVDDEKIILRFWINFIKDVCTALNVELKFKTDEIVNLIKSPYTPWKYFLDSYLYIFYRRGIRPEDYGKRKNPVGFDLEQCIYLYWANIYVIRDSSFYSFLKELNDLRNYNKNIFDYNKFKNFLSL